MGGSYQVWERITEKLVKNDQAQMCVSVYLSELFLKRCLEFGTDESGLQLHNDCQTYEGFCKIKKFANKSS